MTTDRFMTRGIPGAEGCPDRAGPQMFDTQEKAPEAVIKISETLRKAYVVDHPQSSQASNS